MKITIINTNLPLVLEPGTKLRITEHNQIFTEKAAFSFPFDLPAEDNRLALGFPERIGKANERTYDYDVRIDSKSVPFRQATLVVTPGDKKHKCFLIVGEGRFNDLIRDKKLSDLVDLPVDMGDDYDDFIAQANADVAKSYPDVDFKFPIMVNTEAYENEVINKYFKFLNYYQWHEASPGYAKNNYLNPGLPSYPEQSTGVPGVINPYNISSYIPCAFVFSVLINIIEGLGFKAISNGVLEDTDINQLLFIVNKSIDKDPEIINNYVVKVGRGSNLIKTDITAIVFDQKSGGSYQDEFDKYDIDPESSTRGRFNGHYGDGKDRIFQFHYKLLLYNHTSTAFTGKIAMNHLLSTFAWSDEFTVDAYENKTVEGNLLCYHKGSESYYEGLSNFGISLYSSDSVGGGDFELTVKTASTLDIIPISDTLTIVPKNTFNLADNMPDITFVQLLADLKWLFGLFPFEDGDNVVLKFFKDIYAELPSADISEYLLAGYEKNKLEKVKSIAFQGGFDSAEFAYTAANTFPYSTIPQQKVFRASTGSFHVNNHDQYYNFAWELWKADLNKRNVNADGNDIAISAKLPALIMSNHLWTEPDHWLPIIELKDNLVSPFNPKAKAADYMLAFWRGMQNDDSADTYPFATPYAYKIGGTVIANRQLRFNGDYGLWNGYLRDMVNTMNAENNLITMYFDMPGSMMRSIKFYKNYLISGMKCLIYSKDYEIDVDTDSMLPNQQMVVIKL